MNYGNEARRDLFQDNRTVLTSTPLRGSPNSFHSDQSSSHSGTKFNSTPSPLRFSSPSNSPTFSPTSPTYSNNFPDLGARARARTPQSPCLADFITTKSGSQKNRKRIKPTQLMSVMATPNIQVSDGIYVAECIDMVNNIIVLYFIDNSSTTISCSM